MLRSSLSPWLHAATACRSSLPPVPPCVPSSTAEALRRRRSGPTWTPSPFARRRGRPTRLVTTDACMRAGMTGTWPWPWEHVTGWQAIPTDLLAASWWCSSRRRRPREARDRSARVACSSAWASIASSGFIYGRTSHRLAWRLALARCLRQATRRPWSFGGAHPTSQSLDRGGMHSLLRACSFPRHTASWTSGPRRSRAC